MRYKRHRVEMGEVEGERSTYIYLRMQYCWMALTDIPRLIVIVFNLLNPVAVAAQIVSSPAVTRLQSTYQDSFQECAKSTSRMTCRTMSTIAPAIPIPITTTEWERQTAVEPARTDGAAVHYHSSTSTEHKVLCGGNEEEPDSNAENEQSLEEPESVLNVRSRVFSTPYADHQKSHDSKEDGQGEHDAIHSEVAKQVPTNGLLGRVAEVHQRGPLNVHHKAVAQKAL